MNWARCLSRSCLCICVGSVFASAGSVRADEPPEPEPAEYEPPPAELEPEPIQKADKKQAEAERKLKQQRAGVKRRQQLYAGFGWSGAAITLALIGSGTTLGLLAQSRSDELGLLTVKKDDGVAKVFEGETRTEYERLKQEGTQFGRATIGCLVAAGVMAVGTGALFYGQTRADNELKKLSWLPFVSQNKVGLAFGGSF